MELHKGDSVSMLTYTVFDTATLRYYLTPVGIDLINSGGVWQVSINELAENAYEYERAHLNLSGYLHYMNNNYTLTDRAVFKNSSVYLPITPPFNESAGLENMSAFIPSSNLMTYVDAPIDKSSGSKVCLHGRLNLEPLRFSYSFTLEPNPSDVFWFPYFG